MTDPDDPRDPTISRRHTSRGSVNEGRTKLNRTRMGVAKSHAGDALSVESVGKVVD